MKIPAFILYRFSDLHILVFTALHALRESRLSVRLSNAWIVTKRQKLVQTFTEFGSFRGVSRKSA